MKLAIFLAATLAAASSDPIPYTTQPTEHFSNNAESYQSAVEQQQHGVYGDQSQYSQRDFSQSEAGYSQGQSVAFPSGQTSFAGQSTYTGQNAYAQNFQQNQRPATEKTARIISLQNENKGNSYQYSYETENGIKVQERGELQGKNIRAQGAYSYTGDDGQVYSVTYTADENGFHPQGAHLPTPPPIPEAIQKSIELNAREAASNNGAYDDGSYKEENELRHQQRHRIQPQQINHQIQQFQDIQPVQAVHIPEIQQIQSTSEHQQNQEVQQIQNFQHSPEVQNFQHSPEVQQIQNFQHNPEVQQIQNFQHNQEVQHIPEIQEVQPQVQHFQHGQELYEPGYQQDYQQVTATTAGYSGW